MVLESGAIETPFSLSTLESPPVILPTESHTAASKAPGYLTHTVYVAEVEAQDLTIQRRHAAWKR